MVGKMTRGGKREGAGRPPVQNPKRRHNVMLTDLIAEFLRNFGNGNLSAGIALAVEFIKSFHIQKGD